MSLNDFATAVACRTDDERRALVEAIHSSPTGTQETNWLEWKNGLDPATNEGRFAIAKAILGFANRAVDQAQLACEGVAYMVVGVQPGAAAGVPAFDHAALGQKVKTYADGPRWTPHYVDFDGKTVLVILVEPPRRGDPIHTLQKEYTKDKTTHRAGVVFHRGTAHTEPAGPKEIAMLGERLLAGTRKSDLDLTLVPDAEPLVRLDFGSDKVDEWLRRHEAYVRSQSGAPPDPPPPRPKAKPHGYLADHLGIADLPSEIAGLTMPSRYARPEDRAEFERRLMEYLNKLRGGVLVNNAIEEVVRGDHNKVGVSVGNLTDDSVSSVQLTVIVPKAGLTVYTTFSAKALPSMPKWPSFTDSMMASVVPPPALSHYDLYDAADGSVTELDNTYELVWDIGNIRPQDWSEPVEFTVIPGPQAPDQVEIEVVARAMDRRGTTRETATLNVMPDEHTLDDFYVAEPTGPG